MMTSFERIIKVCLSLALILAMTPAFSHAASWKAGVASVTITPEEPMWMAGYGSRDKPSEGKIHDLHVKALAIEDENGAKLVIVTADIIAVTTDFSNSVADIIRERHGIPREAILINSSHTHCGPESRTPFPFYIPKEWEPRIADYIDCMKTRYVQAIENALNDVKPMDLGFTTARPVPFAVSRRFPTPEGIAYRSGPSSYYTGGPRDDTMPVLVASESGGAVRAIVFGYACHPITLNIYKFCGGYPGFAQQYIEEEFPEAVAMFVQGCAGQLVPNARYQIEYAEGHGRALALAVKNALGGRIQALSGPIVCAYDEVPLEFEPLPGRESLENDLDSADNNTRRKAEYFLAKLDNGEQVSNVQNWPFQAIRFGDDLLMVGMSGETVVDYAVRFKSSFLTYKFVWVAGYSNHASGYLPTWQIQREGGYEGGTSMAHMPVTGPFTETVEKRVVDGVTGLVSKLRR